MSFFLGREKPANGADAAVVALTSKDFTSAVVNGDWVAVQGRFNIAIWGDGVGTVKLQKSYDLGVTPIDVALDTAGNPAAFVKATGQTMALTVDEPERGVVYRWVCTVRSSGTLSTRISQ